MYENEELIDFEIPEDDAGMRHNLQLGIKIGELKRCLENISREIESVGVSIKDMTSDTNSLRHLHSLMFGDRSSSESPVTDPNGFDSLCGFMENRNRVHQNQLASLSDDAALSHTLLTQYQDALNMAKIRSEINRMRIVSRIRHPCGEIHLFSRRMFMGPAGDARSDSIRSSTTSVVGSESSHKQVNQGPSRRSRKPPIRPVKLRL